MQTPKENLHVTNYVFGITSKLCNTLDQGLTFSVKDLIINILDFESHIQVFKLPKTNVNKWVWLGSRSHIFA